MVQRKMTLSAFRLVRCKPHFHYTIHVATRHDFSWKKKMKARFTALLGST